MDADASSSSSSELEQILHFEENASNYFNQGKYEDAYGIATKQYELGLKAQQIPLLVKCYVYAMNTNRPRKAVEYQEEFFALLKEINVEPSPKSVEKSANKYLEEKNYFLAFLMFQLTLKRCEKEVNMADTVNLLHRCCAKTTEIVSRLSEKNDESSKKLIRNYMLPYMRRIIERIKQFEHFDCKEVGFVQAVCLHYLEQCQFQVGDLDGREESLIEAINTMKIHWEDDACKKHIYGGCLNNLGHTYLIKQNVKEARKMFAKAIAAKQCAEDYDTPEEKAKDVKKSETALETSRN